MADLPKAAMLDRWRGRTSAAMRAEPLLREMALLTSDRTGRGIADEALRRMGPDLAYLNVGHSNLDKRLWARLDPLLRVLMIHDTIPLDHPEFTRKGQSERFRERFAGSVSQADGLLSISEASRADLIRWRKALHLAETAAVTTAPIGTRLVPPDPSGLPEGLDLSRPFFVTLGTIEPRKNHALLLDAWEELARRLPAARLPRLFIIGRRGWENHETFARLDRLAPNGAVRELSGLDDAAVAALLDRCHALLMPSRAEGFGLPLTEAAARGVPVICSPLPVAREILGDYARYLSADDHRAWAGSVSLLAGALPLRLSPLTVPQWQSHFDLVRGCVIEGLRARQLPGYATRK